MPDFSAGAMENWGLILYRETALLYDAVTTPSAYSRQRVALVVSHELAHQVNSDSSKHSRHFFSRTWSS